MQRPSHARRPASRDDEFVPRGPERLRRKGRGQYLTPPALARQLVDFAASDLEAAGHRIPAGAGLDPACGDGVFLEEIRGWCGRLVGVDLDPDVLVGPVTAELSVGDGLEDDGRRYAVVVGNPPFGRERIGPFVRRFVSAAMPGGVVAVLLPESWFASRRDAETRNWALQHARCVSVTSVYGRDFLRTGTRARTCWSVWVRRDRPLSSVDDVDGDPPVLMRQPRDEEDHELAAAPGSRAFEVEVETAELRMAGRWDPRFYDPLWDDPLTSCVLPVRPLGEFVHDIVYGALGRGVRPRPHEGAGGFLYVGQKTLTEAGIVPARCPRIVDERPFVQERYTLRPGDLVVPRSGMGTLGKNLLTRWDGVPADCNAEGAVVDCFDDRVSLEGISSAWVLGVLRTEPGWWQIRRVITGVAQPNLSFKQIRALSMPVPSAAVQEEAERRWAEVRSGTQPFEHLRQLVRQACSGAA